MATTVDCLRIAIEETARYEGAPSTTPYRISTDTHDLPIQTANFGPNVQHLDRSDELRGVEGGPEMLVETYEPGGSLAIRGYVNSLTWLLHCAGFTGTVTAGDGVITDPDAATIPTGAYRWVFTKRTGLSAKTMQMLLNYTTHGVFAKGQGVGVSSLAMNGDGAVTAELMGLVYANTADPDITPAYDSASIPPPRRGDLTVTWLGGSGTTDDFSFTIANPLVRRRTFTLATPSYFPDVLEQGDEKVRVTGSIPKSKLADADIDALVAATAFSATARWKLPTNIGATSYKYSIWLEMPKAQYTAGSPDPLANRRRFGGSFDFWAAWDFGQGFDAKITLVNAVDAIETYA